MRLFVLLAITTLAFSACNNSSKHLDDNGALLVDFLTYQDGNTVAFAPMKHEDSAFVANFQPEICLFEGEPYTGKVALYDGEKLKLDGQLKDGKFDGKWAFYYPSGVVQIEGTYTNGIETGMWTTYYRKDYPKMMKFYDEKGYLLMRKEYFDNGKVKNYQNVKSPQFGDLERRVQFNYKGEVEYIDAERELGRLEPAAINKLLQDNGLMVK
ncbi:MAG: hypothetical protein IPO47_18445 [Bacteroidetes bacterium]|jgi:antitoxin component YwqK of YwqJK toxin-antitoxin module|nr:hypothetical protein [Bacteroidota bacterium]MBP9881068.1 hypothetical protein [Chitinophagales bacterium]